MTKSLETEPNNLIPPSDEQIETAVAHAKSVMATGISGMLKDIQSEDSVFDRAILTLVDGMSDEQRQAFLKASDALQPKLDAFNQAVADFRENPTEESLLIALNALFAVSSEEIDGALDKVFNRKSD